MNLFDEKKYRKKTSQIQWEVLKWQIRQMKMHLVLNHSFFSASVCLKSICWISDWQCNFNSSLYFLFRSNFFAKQFYCMAKYSAIFANGEKRREEKKNTNFPSEHQFINGLRIRQLYDIFFSRCYFPFHWNWKWTVFFHHRYSYRIAATKRVTTEYIFMNQTEGNKKQLCLTKRNIYEIQMIRTLR